MATTLAEIRTLALEYIDDRAQDRWSDAQILPLINEAQREIQANIDEANEEFFVKGQSYTVATTHDSYEFDLPADFERVVRAERERSGKKPLEAIWLDYSSRHEAGVGDHRKLVRTQERPVCYLRGDKIGVVDPSGSYTLCLWYNYEVPDLAIDADETLIPDRWANLIALVAAKLTHGEDSGGLPQGLEEVLRNGLSRMRNGLMKRQLQESRHAQHSPEDSETFY